jgi:hypothetical protein
MNIAAMTQASHQFQRPDISIGSMGISPKTNTSKTAVRMMNLVPELFIVASCACALRFFVFGVFVHSRAKFNGDGAQEFPAAFSRSGPCWQKTPDAFQSQIKPIIDQAIDSACLIDSMLSVYTVFWENNIRPNRRTGIKKFVHIGWNLVCKPLLPFMVFVRVGYRITTQIKDPEFGLVIQVCAFYVIA